MKSFLKVKLEYLAGEARINKKHHEKLIKKAAAARARVKSRGDVYKEGFLANSMYRHRIDVIRPELRSSHLAYNFLRGNKYSEVETRVRSWPNWKKVEAIARDFNTTQTGNWSPWYMTEQVLTEKFAAFMADAANVQLIQSEPKSKVRALKKSKEQWLVQKMNDPKTKWSTHEHLFT